MEFFSKISFFFGAIGVFNCLLVSTYFLFNNSHKNVTNRIFGLFLLVLSLRILKSLFYSFSTEEPIYFLQFGPSFFLLIGPLFFSYIINLIKPNAWIAKNWKYHALIWLISVITLTFIFPFSSNVIWNKSILLPLINLQLISYILLSAFIVFRATKSNYNNVSLLKKWMILITLSMVVLWCVFFFVSFDFFISGSIVFSTLFYLFFLYFIFNKRSSSKIFKQVNNNNDLDFERSTELIRSLTLLMNEKKLYTNSNLKSSEVANQLNISTHEFSRLVNEIIGKSFTNFINEYRVQEAKLLISSNSKFTLEAIGNMSGFNSKSAFYRAFKRFTGMTPAKYKA